MAKSKIKEKIKKTERVKKGFKRIRLIYAVNAPDRNYLPYFSSNLDDYRAFKRGEFVSFPDEIVEKIQAVSKITDLEESEMPKQVVKEDVKKVLDFKDDPDKLDKPQEEIAAVDFYAELVAIKGIGPSSATDLIQLYSERDDLLTMLNRESLDKDIPEAILKSLTEHYNIS